MGIRGIAAAVLAAGAAVATLASPAQAAAPEFEQLSPETYVFEGVCAFPVEYRETSNKGVARSFSDGSFIATGSYKVRVSNLEDPTKYVEVNATGQIAWSERLGERALGRTIFILFDGEDWTDGLYLRTGSWTITRYGTGSIERVDGHGTASANLCDLIA
jgi:hypothetical protein